MALGLDALSFGEGGFLVGFRFDADSGGAFFAGLALRLGGDALDLGFALGFRQFGLGDGLPLIEFRLRGLLRGVFLRVRLLVDGGGELLLGQLDFFVAELDFAFPLGDFRVGGGDVDLLLALLLLDLVGGVGVGLRGVGLDLQGRFFQSELGVLLDDDRLGVDLRLIGLLGSLGPGDADVAVGVGFRDGGFFGDLRDVVDAEVLDDVIPVGEILDVEVHQLDAELPHVGDDVLLHLRRDPFAVLDQLADPDGADDFPHIAFEHLLDLLDEVFLFHAEGGFERPFEQDGIAGDLEVGDPIDVDVDELVGRDGLTGFDVDLEDFQGEAVLSLKEGDAPSGLAPKDLPFAKARDHDGLVRPGFGVRADEEDHQESDGDRPQNNP